MATPDRPAAAVGRHDVEGLVRNVVDGAFLESIDFGEPSLDPFPAELFCGPDLAVY